LSYSSETEVRSWNCGDLEKAGPSAQHRPKQNRSANRRSHSQHSCDDGPLIRAGVFC
jgi:hypothetical protein